MVGQEPIHTLLDGLRCFRFKSRLLDFDDEIVDALVLREKAIELDLSQLRRGTLRTRVSWRSFD